jgi:hypothetical protein
MREQEENMEEAERKKSMNRRKRLTTILSRGNR